MHLISFFTKVLHYLPSEISHYLALEGLKFLYSTGILRFLFKPDNKIVKDHSICDLGNISNKVGIAAGLDKNGDYIDCLAALGVGFIELGTVTPKPQPGNSKPRIFRNKKNKSILNRLGFNNKGVDYLVKKLKERKSRVLIGSSIGKNFDTPNDKAYLDYITCMEKVYEYSDYVAVNISSPNTKDLRELSRKNYLNNLLSRIKVKQKDLSLIHGYKPIFLKISPDENFDSLGIICETILKNELDGIICSNTTNVHKEKNGFGGLSGKPLKNLATNKLIQVKQIIGDKAKLIASGGVMTPEDFQEKIDAGADLVQIYTGFIYEGPKLIVEIQNQYKSIRKT